VDFNAIRKVISVVGMVAKPMQPQTIRKNSFVTIVRGLGILKKLVGDLMVVLLEVAGAVQVKEPSLMSILRLW
jgi:hypothetical protein